jgi:hypothetical protein
MFACGAAFLTRALLAMALSPQCGVPVLEGNPVGPLVRKHIGKEAASCGRLWCRSDYEIKPSSGQVAQLQACMAEAYRHQRSFFFSIEEDGMDSYVATGLMRRESGPLQRFWYNSHPSPTPGYPARFVIADCPMPVNPKRIDPLVDCTRGIKRSTTRGIRTPPVKE